MDDNPINLELPSAFTLSEVMTICIVFHHSGYRTFKKYYQDLISQRYRNFFPRLVSYNHFVELMPYTALPLAYFVCSHKGNCTGINFVDSTTLDVCDTHRIPQHKVFQEVAQRGKSSTGWFYGFKLHLMINDRGEILSFCLTAGNTDDRNPKVMDHLTRYLEFSLLTKAMFPKNCLMHFGRKGSNWLPSKKRMQKRKESWSYQKEFY